jgi:short-chain fatty acids transporter
MASYFGEGVWSFLGFSMQMVLILVTGSALATSRPVSRLLRVLAATARTPGQAVMLATLTMIVGCWLNWGFGLIVGALIARELAKRIERVHYPLLVASAYSGFIVWHAGFSGSIPLKIAGADEIMARYAGGATVPASQTIFAWQNIVLVLVFLCTLPLLNRLMHPRRSDQVVPAGPAVDADENGRPRDAGTDGGPAARLEESRILTAAVVAVCVSYLVIHFRRGGRINLNIVNFLFLTAGIALHRTPIRYVRAVNDAVRTCGGIVLQFPFYAGIMGMMMKSGLAVTLSQMFVGFSSVRTFPFFTYLSAGIVNFFVPSGGGQWAVQGPIMIPAAGTLGVPYATTAMAIAWGDAWTNLIQPFWALPLLAVAGLHIRDIMGYTAVALLYTGVVISLFMLFVF